MSSNYINEYMLRLKDLMRDQYTFKPTEHDDPNIKRGLRNADGTGVLLGITKIGSVQGYTIQDGERMPAPGRLYYRGISLEDIVESERCAGYEYEFYQAGVRVREWKEGERHAAPYQ